VENNSDKYWSAKSRGLVSAVLYKLGKRPALPYYTTIISSIAQQLKPSVYLEVGVFQCVTFNEVSKHANLAIGSDLIESSRNFFSHSNQELVVGDIDVVADFLFNRNLSLGMVFIDANHQKEFVVRDFEALEPFLDRNSLVIFHDTFPGTREQSAPEFCGDAYLAVPLLREKFPNYSFVTLPIHPGLTFATKTIDMPLWTNS
jgi:hypothetical protein